MQDPCACAHPLPRHYRTSEWALPVEASISLSLSLCVCVCLPLVFHPVHVIGCRQCAGTMGVCKPTPFMVSLKEPSISITHPPFDRQTKRETCIQTHVYLHVKTGFHIAW